LDQREEKNIKKLYAITPSDWGGVCDFNKELLQNFLTDGAELSPVTRRVYESNLKIWFVWVKDNLGNKKQIEIKPLEFKRFQNWMIARDCSSSDISNKRAAISSLNNYLEIYFADEYPLFRNFINKSIARPPKVAKNAKEPLNKNEFEHLLSELNNKKAFQKIAYCEFTFDTGCRRAESRQLLKCVIETEPVIKEKDGKRIVFYLTNDIRCKGRGSEGKVRKFAFSEKTMAALKKWLEVRGSDDCKFMFVHKVGGVIKQVTETTFNAWAAGLFTRIVGRRVYPHLLRSSRATQLVIEEGKDITIAQKLLGHESSVTTEGYVIRDDSEDLDELYLED